MMFMLLIMELLLSGRFFVLPNVTAGVRNVPEENNFKSRTLQQFAQKICWQAEKRIISLHITEI
jgi:hypothetical protein